MKGEKQRRRKKKKEEKEEEEERSLYSCIPVLLLNELTVVEGNVSGARDGCTVTG